MSSTNKKMFCPYQKFLSLAYFLSFSGMQEEIIFQSKSYANWDPQTKWSIAGIYGRPSSVQRGRSKYKAGGATVCFVNQMLYQMLVYEQLNAMS